MKKFMSKVLATSVPVAFGLMVTSAQAALTATDVTDPINATNVLLGLVVVAVIGLILTIKSGKYVGRAL